MKKFTAILLAVVMLLALSVSAFAEDTTPVTTKAVDTTLSVTVDYTIEGMYFDGTTLKNTGTAVNGYYPYSFSFIVSDRTKVASVTVSGNGLFHWAYAQTADGSYVTDEDGNYVESDTTNYGVVVLPTTSASTVTVTSKSGGTLTISCAQPSGGTTATGTALYAYLPAPAQFVNEGVTTGGWGDAYDSSGNLKSTNATGLSLGFFGGYAVYKFGTPIFDTAEHPYGADFIVYGNAFWGNSEAGCIQVSPNGTDWYDIAGSMYYTKSTKNATITYTNPNPNEDKGITAAGTNLGTLAPVKYTLNGGAEQEITTNSFHNHSWFPLNANYFAASGSRAAMDKDDELSFVSRTLNSDNITSTLTFKGTLLNNYPGTGKTDKIGFGYCDVHPNKTLGGTIAYNPYQTFTSSSDYDTKVAGTSGGDPIDIAWAVDPEGKPAKLESIQYVRIYTGMAQMNGVFGEISTEVCGVAACDATTGTGESTAIRSFRLTDRSGERVTVSDNGIAMIDEGICTVRSSAEHIMINGVAAGDGAEFEIHAGEFVQIIMQTGTESPYIVVAMGK